MTDRGLPELPEGRIDEIARQRACEGTPRRTRRRRIAPWIGAVCILVLAGLTLWALSRVNDEAEKVNGLKPGQAALGQALDQANTRLKQLGGQPVRTPTAVIGSPGPAGPPGASGAAGSNGSNGTTGPRGPR